MERKRFLAVVMTVMMVISMIPSMVFAAAPSGELGGKLKIKGLAAVGVVLSADYAKVTPEEDTDCIRNRYAYYASSSYIFPNEESDR